MRSWNLIESVSEDFPSYSHITNMAAMPIYGKNLKKSSSPEAIGR